MEMIWLDETPACSVSWTRTESDMLGKGSLHRPKRGPVLRWADGPQEINKPKGLATINVDKDIEHAIL